MNEKLLADLAIARGALDRIEAMVAGGATTAPLPEAPRPFGDFAFEDWTTPRPDTHVEGKIGEGAYRLTAKPHLFDFIDPFVFPGQRPAGHLHMIWGNLLVDEHSTTESLMLDGRAIITGEMINRSAYWQSALRIGGLAWVPDWIAVYYKLDNPHAPNAIVQGDLSRIRAMPNGLTMIFGNTLDAEAASAKVWFTVLTADQKTQLWHKPTLAGALELLKPGCKLVVSLAAPECWNGELGSDDHRSHMAYAVNRGGRMVAPDSHPFVIPRLTYKTMFTVPDRADMRALRASSDAPGQMPGSTMHAEYMGAHHPEAVRQWHANALLRQLDCSGADFGSGRGGKTHPALRMDAGNDNLVPYPARFDPERRVWEMVR